MKYLYALFLCVSFIYADSEFVDFNKLEEEFHIHTPKNKQTLNLNEFIERVEKNSCQISCFNPKPFV